MTKTDEYREAPDLPAPTCPDKTPHARHRIAGTWRTECPGVGPVRDTEIPDLSSKAEVAAMLGCSHQYVQRLIEDGRLPALKVGATWVIRTALVEAWGVDEYAAGETAPAEVAS